LGRRKTDDEFPFLFIGRRIQGATNSAPRPRGVVRTGYNPLWMNPADMARIGVDEGSEVAIRSRHGEIVGFVEADPDMREGVVGMTHGFGPKPGLPYDPRRDGSNVNELISWEDDADPYHGMPRMSALPVSVTARAGRAGATAAGGLALLG